LTVVGCVSSSSSIAASFIVVWLTMFALLGCGFFFSRKKIYLSLVAKTEVHWINTHLSSEPLQTSTYVGMYWEKEKKWTKVEFTKAKFWWRMTDWYRAFTLWTISRIHENWILWSSA
jgi:hypothetical protein